MLPPPPVPKGQLSVPSSMLPQQPTQPQSSSTQPYLLSTPAFVPIREQLRDETVNFVLSWLKGWTLQDYDKFLEGLFSVYEKNVSPFLIVLCAYNKTVLGSFSHLSIHFASFLPQTDKKCEMISKHFLPKYTPAEIKRCYYTLQHFIRMAEVDDSNAFLRSQAQASPFFMQTFEPPPKRASILPTAPNLEQLTGLGGPAVAAAAAAAMQQQFMQQQQEILQAATAATQSFALPTVPFSAAQTPQNKTTSNNTVYNVSFNFPSANLGEMPLAFSTPPFLNGDNGAPAIQSPAIPSFAVEPTASGEFVKGS